MRARCLVLATVCAAPCLALAGTVTTRAGRVFEAGPAVLTVSEERLGVQFIAPAPDGFQFQFLVILPPERRTERTFDFDLTQRSPAGPNVSSGPVGMGKRVREGTAHLVIGDGRFHLDVDTPDPESAATVDTELWVDCASPAVDGGLDVWLETPSCKPFRDLWPGGVPRTFDGGSGMLVGITAALVEGTVTHAEETYDDCRGPRRVHTLSGVKVRAGAPVGRTLKLEEFGGPLPDGSIWEWSNATSLARGKRYLLNLVDDSGWRWFKSPLAIGNALQIENLQGKDVLITSYGALVYGFDGDSWVPGPTVAEPANDLDRPFDPPSIHRDIPADYIAWALTPDEAVQAFRDFSVRHEIPVTGTFHPEPDPRQCWGGDTGCSAAGGHGAGPGALVLLLVWSARRRRGSVA